MSPPVARLDVALDRVPLSPTARVPPPGFGNCAAGINAALSESIAMGSTAAHLHNEEEVEHGWGEAAPYGLPTLFVYNGEEICFWPPNGAV